MGIGIPVRCYMECNTHPQTLYIGYPTDPTPAFDGTTNSVITSMVEMLTDFPLGETYTVMFYVTQLDVSYLAVLGCS